jgi:VanZ family protein
VRKIFRRKPEAPLPPEGGSCEREATLPPSAAARASASQKGGRYEQFVASAFERKAWLLWGPVVLYMGIIFFVSHEPDVSIPAGLSDEQSHSMAYTLLGVLMVRALAGGLGAPIALRTALLGILLTTLYGASDEFHQVFVAGRSAELYDIYADATGGAIGAFACWLWGIISPSWPLKT